jgi:hypothetical protein
MYPHMYGVLARCRQVLFLNSERDFARFARTAEFQVGSFCSVLRSTYAMLTTARGSKCVGAHVGCSLQGNKKERKGKGDGNW